MKITLTDLSFIQNKTPPTPHSQFQWFIYSIVQFAENVKYYIANQPK